MWMVAGVWMLLAAVSAFIAIRVKMPAALVEIVIGMIAGNLIALRTNAWIDFVAGFGSILLTFLAGAEIDPAVLRRQLLPSTAIGAGVVRCSVFCGDGVYILLRTLDVGCVKNCGHRNVDYLGGGSLCGDG